jgi:DNA-binding transcriptional regulator YhcF (GntR family)
MNLAESSTIVEERTPPMPIATQAPEKVVVICKEPGCDKGPNGGPWSATVPANKQTQVLGMHRARYHGYRTTNPATLHQAAIRAGEVVATVAAESRQVRIQERITESIRIGVYEPGRKLVLSELAREFDVGTNSVRQILYRLSRLTSHLVHQKDGAFYVMGETQAAERVASRRFRGSRKKTFVETVADQLRSELGTKYPLGSGLPPGYQLGEIFGFSDNTMNRAVGILRDEGLLNRSRTVIALPPTATPAVEPSPAPPHIHADWSAVKEAREADTEVAESAQSSVEAVEQHPAPAPGGTDPLGTALDFLTRLADLGATAELQRLWALEASAPSPDAWARMQAEIDKVRTELIVAQGENRNLVSGINTLREEKASNQQAYKSLKESYTKLQAAHEEILKEYERHRAVAQTLGDWKPSNGAGSLAVEAALAERKPLPHRRSY